MAGTHAITSDVTTVARSLDPQRGDVLRRRRAARCGRARRSAPLGAAGERLDAHRAGPGVQVDHDGVLDEALRDQRVEHGLADLVGGRPGGQPLGCDELPAAELTRHHAHRRQLNEGTLAPCWYRNRPSCASTAAGAATCSPTRARTASGSPGDIVAYRCEDCRDRWDLVLPDEDDGAGDAW